jgi:ribosomal protein S18 acetylase RimI-like enzyme
MPIASSGFRLRLLEELDEATAGALADVLVDCVEGGASVSFMLPLSRERAMGFWQGLAMDVAARRRLLLVAEDDRGILGTVQAILSQPENQPHRADIAKLLVHRRARNRGVGAALMTAMENAAAASGKAMLVLDTASAEAERLYRRLDWQTCGIIPDYALLPAGGFCPTTIFYKRVSPGHR